jgi:hypothetical protein
MRTPTIPWDVEKQKLLEFRQRGLSYGDINKYLHATYGHSVTQARLSQVFTGWRKEILADVDRSVAGTQQLDV